MKPKSMINDPSLKTGKRVRLEHKGGSFSKWALLDSISEREEKWEIRDYEEGCLYLSRCTIFPFRRVR